MFLTFLNNLIWDSNKQFLSICIKGVLHYLYKTFDRNCLHLKVKSHRITSKDRKCCPCCSRLIDRSKQLSPWAHFMNCLNSVSSAVADPGFPVGGRRPHGGRQLLRWLCFEKFVCQNERIWTHGGARTGSAPWIRHCSVLCIVKINQFFTVTLADTLLEKMLINLNNFCRFFFLSAND